MSDIAIKVERLSKAYKLYNNPVDRMKESLHPFRKKYHHDFYALKDVSFEVKKGNSVGIIGVNGSGKSTLLKMIAGVLTPTSGNFIVNGKISALLELGAGFNPEFTGFENVYFQGAIMGYTREEMDNKADDILSFADIGEFIYQSVKTYSSGMFVRLAFAVAVAVDPDILIIDEALAVGDVRFQLKCMKKMNSFKEEGKTILLVTHGLDTLKNFTNIGIFLNNGKIQYMGDPVEAGLSYYRFLFPNNNDRTSGTGDTFEKNKIGTDENSKLDKSKYVEANLDDSKSFKIDMDENSKIGNSKYLEVNLDDNKSYGKGGAWINCIRIYGLKDENVFVGGKELNINISYAWNKDEIKRLIDENILLSNLLFGVRFENARGIVLTDVATLRFDNFHIDPLSHEDSSCVLNFKIQIPKLMAGDYFLSPGIALGELNNMLALKEYVYLINLHCLPDEKILGLMKWDYAISEIERG